MRTRGQGHCLTFDPGLSQYDNFNIFSKATGPVVIKFQGKKVCSNSPGHMTNMGSMLIHGNNIYISSSLEQVDRLPYNLIGY